MSILSRRSGSSCRSELMCSTKRVFSSSGMVCVEVGPPSYKIRLIAINTVNNNKKNNKKITKE